MINFEGKRCNDNISNLVTEKDITKIERKVGKQFQKVLDALLIDTANDHNTQDTAKRVAKMLVREVFAGRYEPKPRVTSFPNANQYDQLYLTGPIKIRSTCAHHFQPIVGNAWIGVFPGKEVIGLSKFNRLVDWVASRPQIQEEMTVQIADLIEEETKAEGIAVVIKAEHMCLTHRGVKEHESDMTTSIVRGSLREEETQKREFFNLLKGMKGFYE
ncbi:MAG: GTP cyclohydrolase [Methanobacteriota archaeon]|jgi:GTP cyclohydrolase I|nr:MAG: GTP cyclohydrolase [Euryarchaeota archaeon]